MARQKSENLESLKENFREYKRKRWAELREEIFGRAGEGLRSQFELALDNADLSVVDLLQDTQLNISGIRLEELTRLEEVERKIEEGTYGICEQCGEEIPGERLKIMPYAVYCVTCKEEREGEGYPPPRATL